MRENSQRPGLWPGFLLVCLGAGLLARELGLLPAHVRVLDFWPLFIVLVGISILLRRGGWGSALLGLAFTALGSVLLAGNLGFLATSVTRFWPVLVILLGLHALLRRGAEEGPSPPAEYLDEYEGDLSAEGVTSTALSSQDRLQRQYTCAGAELRIESRSWKGGELGVTAGGVELDLRHAQLDPDGALLVVSVLMGGVDIRVPDTWHVSLDVVPFLGGADDMTRSTQGVSSAPRLRITGNVTLGGVSVSN